MRLNETATKQKSPSIEVLRPEVWVGKELLAFEGPMGFLDWHQHSFVCLLIGTGGPFEVIFDGHHLRCECFLVPAGLDHQLEFYGQRMFSLYIPAHHRQFPLLQNHPKNAELRTEWTVQWQKAMDIWQEERDPSALQEQALRTWTTEVRGLDVRVLRIVRALAVGEHLDTDTAGLASWQGISASRLTHLLKDSLGVGLRKVKRGYRFVLAALAMAEGASLTEAAHASGFADSSHFSRSFRAAYGLPPSHALLSTTKWNLLDAPET